MNRRHSAVNGEMSRLNLVLSIREYTRGRLRTQGGWRSRRVLRSSEELKVLVEAVVLILRCSS